MIWGAVLMVLGQGLIIGLLLYFVRTFGAYTEALLQAQESNLIVRQKITQELEELRRTKEAYLLAVREAAGRVA